MYADLSLDCYRLMLRESMSIVEMACIAEITRVHAPRNSVTISVHNSWSMVPTSCETMSKSGFTTIPGLPPAMPTNNISMNTGRRICSMLVLRCSFLLRDGLVSKVLKMVEDEGVEIGFSVSN